MALLFVSDVVGSISLTMSMIGAYGVGVAVLHRVLQFGQSENILTVIVRTVSGLVTISLLSLALQPLVNVRITSTATLTAGVMVVVVNVFRRRKAATAAHGSQPHDVPCGETIAIFVIAFLYLGRDFRWANTAFLGALLVMAGMAGRIRNRTLRLAALSVGCSVVVLSAVLRGGLWWYVTNDHHWFEAIGDSVALFGPWDPLGINADIGLRYHFLTYLISTILGSVFSLEPFLMLTRGLPVLIAVSISATFWSILGSLIRAKIAPRLVGAALVPFLFNYSHASPSHTFGVLLLMLLMAVVLLIPMAQSSIAQLLFGTASALALTLAKASVVPPAILGVVAVAALAKYRRRTVNGIWFTVAFLLVSVTYILWQLFSSRASDQLETGQLFGYALERSGDLKGLGYTRLGVISMLLVTSALFVPLILSWIVTKSHKLGSVRSGHSERLVWFVAPTLAYGLALAVLRGNHSIGYFVTAALYVMAVPMILVIVNLVENLSIEKSRWKSAVTVLVIPLIVWAVQRLILPTINGGERFEVFLRSFVKTPWIVPLVVVLISHFASRGMSRKSPTLSASLVIAWSVIVFVAPTLTSPYSLEKGPDATASELASVIGSEDEIAVGEWLKSNLASSAVLATNHFCGEQCAGVGWFTRDVELPKKGFQFAATPTQYGGANFFLAIYSQRRFLAQGTYHLLAAGSKPELLIERVDSSLDFIENPTALAHSRLRSLGATHVVVDKTVTLKRNWDPWGTQKYSNSTFVVLELRV
jgi:hypothetical protein